MQEYGIQAGLDAHGISQRPSIAQRGPSEGAQSTGWLSPQQNGLPAWASLLQERCTGFCTKQRQSKNLVGQILLHFLSCPEHQ